MNTIIMILLLLSLFILLLSIAALKVIFTFDSDKENVNLIFEWLHPFLKAEVTIIDTQPVLTIYLFGKGIAERNLKRTKRKINNGMELVRNFKPRDINVYASYGFRDPSITGVTCGALNAVSQFINIDSLQNDPNFVTDNDYIYVNANAKFNVITALINMYRTRRAGSGNV